jgi:hypothetical protein
LSDGEVDDRYADENFREIMGVLQFGREVETEVLVVFDVRISDPQHFSIVDDSELFGE